MILSPAAKGPRIEKRIIRGEENADPDTAISYKRGDVRRRFPDGHGREGDRQNGRPAKARTISGGRGSI